jgi:hypothetical protein
VLVLRNNRGVYRFVEVNWLVWLSRQRLELRRFPPHALELNPDGGTSDVAKNDKLANYCPKTLEELLGKVDGELPLLKRGLHRVQNAMRQSELAWEGAQPLSPVTT